MLIFVVFASNFEGVPQDGGAIKKQSAFVTGIFAIFNQLPDRFSLISNMATGKSFLDDLRAIVLDNYTDEQFGVSELVSEYGLSRSQLHRKLKSASGQSISQFIREIRLDEAAKLLRQQDLTASEVAYKVGFNSATYFNTCFNEYFGYPPGEAKHHKASIPLARNDSAATSKKNKWVLVWLVTLIVIAGSYFAYSFFQKEKKGAITDTEKPKTIAVLPFKNWSGDPELEYVSDGMTDAVIRRLSTISEIERVIPFTTIIIFKGSDKSITDIAKELNVEYILEGNFKLAGEKVMSNLDLIEVDSNDHLWSFEYQGIWRADEIFSMQAEVAENVSKYMSASVTPDERAFISNIPTYNAEAYKLYLKAEFNYERLSPDGFRDAELLYKQAIDLDSTFIDPYLGLATNYYISGLVWGGMPQEIAHMEGNRYLKMAESINKNKKRSYDDSFLSVRLFGDFYYNWDFVSLSEQVAMLEAKEHKNLLITELAGLIEYHRKFGNFDVAIAYGLQSLDNFQVDTGMITGLSFAHYLKGDKEKAIDFLRSYDKKYPADFFYLMESSKVYYYLEDYSSSKKQLELFLEHFPVYPPIIAWLSAVHAEMEGDASAVEKYLDELRISYQNKVSGSPGWFIALYYMHVDDREKAIEWLNKAYEHHEVELTWLKEEPLLRSIKDDPRYLELYNKIGFGVIEPLSVME